VLLHVVATDEFGNRMAQFDLANAMPKRIEVAYVRTIEPEPAVAVAPAPVRVGKRVPTKAPPRPKPAASAAEETAVAAAPAAPASAAASTPVASDESAPPVEPSAGASGDPSSLASADAGEGAASAAAATAAIAAGPSASVPAGVVTFEWPGATRVSYVLTGNYRGEVNGNAHVEWIRIDDRYQVNLDLVVGPEFAPIITRRMTSEGTIAPSGLVPERYDEDTQMVMRERRRMTVVFESDAVVLANGQRRERLPGVQDTASQFVQLTYLFSTQPDLLRVGNVIGFPLALPRTMDNWSYKVVDDERLLTPFGSVAAFHLKPLPRPGRRNELTAEIWISPDLRFLPVRIRIEQDKDTANYVDLMIARKPEIAAASAAAATTIASSRKTP
jgi:hypothetical protein